MAYGKGKQLLTSSSSNTSPSVLVADCRLLTISIMTQVAGASNITISLSDNGGMQSNDSALFWSVATIIPGQGIFTIDPGARWIRAERASASTTTVLLNRFYQ